MELAEKYKLTLLQLLAYSDNELIIVDGITLNIKDELEALRNPYSPEFIEKVKQAEQNIKDGETTTLDPNDILGSIGIPVYVLFQTDRFKSKSSRVCFGVYTSDKLAEIKANENCLTEYESEIHIEECVLNEFGEL